VVKAELAVLPSGEIRVALILALIGLTLYEILDSVWISILLIELLRETASSTACIG